MLRYELSFGNQSGTATTDTELRFPLPAGTSLVEASEGGSQVGSEVVWDLGTLNPGDSNKRRLTVQLGGSVGNGDLIEVDSAEISGTSNFLTQRTRQETTTRVETVSALAFSIDMPAQPLRNSVPSPIHVTVTNRSAVVQNGVRAELFFPPGLRSMDDDSFSDGGDCTSIGPSGGNRCDAGETAFWNIGTLPPGAGKTVTLVPFAARTTRTAACSPFSAVRSPMAHRISGSDGHWRSMMIGRWNWRSTPTVSRSHLVRRCATN